MARRSPGGDQPVIYYRSAHVWHAEKETFLSAFGSLGRSCHCGQWTFSDCELRDDLSDQDRRCSWLTRHIGASVSASSTAPRPAPALREVQREAPINDALYREMTEAWKSRQA